ncbi:hypothetical protein Taro_053430 [Colocasia esculenta]|uniref:Protein IQ-DOMAIN 1 n=1 Tax=Colocasia esculenta TaxID=4460 RepID=A0A843XML8_COLES|nr:hypothetical protein [Colocasia esculenta]
MNQDKSHGVDKGKWGLTRFKLCGDDFDSVPEDDDLDTFMSSEATVTQPIAEASDVTITQSIDEDPENKQATEAEEDEKAPIEQEEATSSPKSLDEDKAAVIIQSAFRGLQVRRKYNQNQQPSGNDGDGGMWDLSQASVCASTEVQVGDYTENSSFLASCTGLQHKARLHVLRPKEEWDGSTLSSNISKMRIQNRLEAMTRRERALAYAFSQQLRICSMKKKAAQNETDEPNLGWSWLERWMAARAPDNSFMEKCMSKHLEPISGDQRYSIIKKTFDVAVEEMESCGSNDVSVCFENVATPSKVTGETSRPVKSRLKVTRSALQRKTVPSCHYTRQQNNVKAVKRDSPRETENPRQANVAQLSEGSTAEVPA